MNECWDVSNFATFLNFGLGCDGMSEHFNLKTFNCEERVRKKTRPGVDKVKPKGWFKYSLLMDFKD